MQFLRPDIDISRQDIVGNDILDKRGFIVFLLISALCLRHGNRGKDGNAPRQRIVSADKHGVFKLAVHAAQQSEGTLRGGKNLIRDIAGNPPNLIQIRAYQGKLAASHHKALVVHHPDGPVRGILELDNHALKNSAGHNSTLPHHFCIISANGHASENLSKPIIDDFCAFFNRK